MLTNKLNKYKSYILIVFTFIMFTIFISCHKIDRVEFVLGTFCSIKTEGYNNAEQAIDEAFLRLHEIDNIFNANTTKSELITVNNTAFKNPIDVSDELFFVLKTACNLAEQTNSAFEPALGKIIKLWNIGFDGATVPLDSNIKKYLPFSKYTNIDLKNKKVFLKSEYTKLDLGGIVKGYAADEVIKILKQYGVDNAIVNLGGNVFALGKKHGSNKWNVGIRSPLENTQDIGLTIQIENKSVVTSGIYERFFEKDGIKYHHVLDRNTGYPVQNDLLSVTIVSDKSIIADGLATACLVLGYDKSMELLKDFPDIGYIFFFKNGSYKLNNVNLLE